MDESRYWFTKSTIEAMISKACKAHGLIPESQFHAERAVYFLAKGMAALALTVKSEA